MKEITCIKDGFRRIIGSDVKDDNESQHLTNTKNKRKTTAKGNWFSNSDTFIARLTEVLQNSLQSNNEARHPKYSGISDVPLLSNHKEQNDIQRIQNNDLTYLIAYILHLYKNFSRK